MINKKIVTMGVLLTLLTGCSKEETVAPVVVEPVNISIPYENTFDTPENVAIQYSNYVRNEYWDFAYDLMKVPETALFARENLPAVECDISSVPIDYILVSAEKAGASVRLTYGNKIGEAFTNDTDTYIGEVITDTATVVVPIETLEDGTYRIGVQEEYLTDAVIALRVPEACEVWLGDKMLADTSRDDEGYYLITDFVEADFLPVKLVSDVETKEIMLNLNGELATDEYGEVEYTDVTDYTTEFSNKTHLGYPAYDYTWYTGRITNDEAVEFAKVGLQELFTSIVEQEDFYTAGFNSILSKDANLEALKPGYSRAQSVFVDSKSREYSDVTIINVTPWTEDYMKRKGVYMGIVDKHTMRIWVTVDYSYVVTVTTEGTESVKTNTLDGYVELSKDNGQWKLMGVSDKILKGM